MKLLISFFHELGTVRFISYLISKTQRYYSLSLKLLEEKVQGSSLYRLGSGGGQPAGWGQPPLSLGAQESLPCTVLVSPVGDAAFLAL